MIIEPAADWRGIDTITLTTTAIETAKKSTGTMG
jgi:hypothetical protein